MHKKTILPQTAAGKLSLATSLRDNAVLRNLISAVFSDCRESYPSRRMYDSDFKTLSNATLGDLYDAWKQINASLVSDGFPRCDMLRWRPTDPKGIRGIRQLTGLLSRLEGVADSQPSLDSFKQRISTARARISDPDILKRAQHIVRSLLGNPPSVWDLHPKHGSGAVATGEKSWDKWGFSQTYRQLEFLVGGNPNRPTPLSADLFHANESIWVAHRHVCEVVSHPVTKVVAVPKDLKRVRIISEEPLSLMFLQQGLMRWLYRHLEARCEGINFSSQDVNAQTCREWRHWASLDLSDASDSVSRRIVRQLVDDQWWRLLSALRSHFVRMPDGTIVPCRAFAPMGNALCFPIESLVFYSSVRAFLEVRFGLSDVFVYGDDILVPVAYAEEVVEFLISIGMNPNLAKCCYKSRFRESCGSEWYDGSDVTVRRPKSLQCSRASRDHQAAATGALPLVEHADWAYNNGFPRLAQAFADLVSLPVSPGCGPGYANPHLRWKNVGRIKYSADYQCHLQLAAYFKAAKGVSTDNGWTALEAFLTAGWSSRMPTQAAPLLSYRWLPLRP